MIVICDKIHPSPTAVDCFDNGYVGKQPVAWKEHCAEYWLKELQESMDRYTGRRSITEILLKTALNTIQSLNISNDKFLDWSKSIAFADDKINVTGKK